MKNSNYLAPSCHAIIHKGLLFLLFLGLAVAQTMAQPIMQISSTPTTINHNNSYQDFKIPFDMTDGAIKLSAWGGDGGHRTNLSNILKAKGGAGATQSAWFRIGYGANELRPGATIRFIVGGKGGSFTTDSGSAGTGGGGGTGILMQPHLSNTWTLLMVAGGGGGAFGDCCFVNDDGKGGRSGQCNTSGDCSGEVPTTPQKGHGASPWDDYNNTYGPSGFLGWPNAVYNSTTWSSTASPTGGSGGDASSATSGGEGGFGFGGGGGSYGGWDGAGGGGFTGGEGGSSFKGGEGGGSFQNTNLRMASPAPTAIAGGTTSNPQHGKCEYVIEKCLMFFGGISTIPAGCSSGSLGSATINMGPATFGTNLLCTISGGPSGFTPPTANTTGIFANVFPAGTYTVTVKDQGVTSFNCKISTTFTISTATGAGPTALCKDFIVMLPNNNQPATVTASQLDNGSNDECGQPTLNISQSSFTSADLPNSPVPVTLTATDSDGNTATCISNVTIDPPCDLLMWQPTLSDGCDPNKPYDMVVDFQSTSNGPFTYLLTGLRPGGGGHDTLATIPSQSIVLDTFQGITLTRLVFLGLPKSWPNAAIFESYSYYSIDVVDNSFASLCSYSTAALAGNSLNPSMVSPSVPSENICSGAQPTVTIDFMGIADGYTFTASGSGVNGYSSSGTRTVDDALLETNALTGFGTVIYNITPFRNAPGGISCTGGDFEVHIFVGGTQPICQSTTVPITDTAPYLLTDSDVLAGNTLNCSGMSVTSITPSTVDCQDIGSTINVTVVTSYAGQTQNCTSQITVEDGGPTFTCPSNRSVALDTTCSVITVPNLKDEVTDEADACSPMSITMSQVPFAGSPLGNLSHGQTVPVTVTAQDANGNTSDCTVTLTAIDQTPPSFTCPQAQNVFTDLGKCEGQVPDLVSPIQDATDNCSSVTLNQNVMAGTTFGTTHNDQTTVTITAVDENGNQNTSCQVTLTLVDDEMPTFTCPGSQSVNTNPGTCEGTVPDLISLINDAADNCGSITLTQSAAIGSTINSSATISIMVDDGNGNQDSNCIVQLTLVDNEPPTFTCPGAQNVNTKTGMCEGIVPDLVTLVTDEADNCGTPILTQSVPTNNTFGTAHNDQITVTITANDGHGNQNSNCQVTLTLIDNEAPNLVCKNHTVFLDGNGNGSMTEANVVLSKSDNCATPFVAMSQSNFDCADLGLMNITVIADDGNGNTGFCTAVVTVTDNIKPNVTCQNKTVQLDASGNASIIEADVVLSKSDNCATPSVALSQSNFGCTDLGIVNITVTADDGNGNTESCTATVTVADNIKPNVTCQNKTVQLDISGDVSILETDVVLSKSDNCTMPSIALSQSNFDCDGLGTVNVTVTADDGNGNTQGCTATITVVDHTNPSVTCQNKTVVLDANNTATIMESDVVMNKSDNCTIPIISLSQTSFDCQDVGSVNVTVTADDGNGNTQDCTATITVVDNIQPTIICQNKTVALDVNNTATIMESDVVSGKSDNCTTPAISLSQTSFDCSNIGSNTVTVMADDGNNNTDTCTATITVVDNIQPTIICQNKTVALDVNNTATIMESDVVSGKSDNCTTPAISLSQTSFDCSHVGSNTVTVMADDGNNNNDTCTAIITVADNIKPTITCQNKTVTLNANNAATIVESDVVSGKSDNCTIPSISLSQTMFDCSNVGSNTVIITADDGNNNTETCTATITVVDNIQPTVICQNPIVQLDAIGNGSIMESDVVMSKSDNCTTPVISLSQTSFDCNDLGMVNVTVSADDGNGNTQTCTAIVTVTDDIKPTVVCQNKTVALNVTGNGSIMESDVVLSKSDNCTIPGISLSQNSFDCNNLGTVTVTITADDGNGNTQNCTSSITIVDTAQPSVTCQNKTVVLDINNTASITESDVVSGKSDNCTTPVITLSQSSFDCNNVGTNTVTVTADDGNGNTRTCTTTVTVTDNTKPTVVCQNKTVVLDATGNGSITETDVVLSKSDNCTTPVITLSQSSFDCSNIGPNMATIIADDGNGNTETCTANVTVQDNTAPAPACKTTTVQLDSSGNYALQQADVFAGGADNCTTVSFFSMAPISVSCTDAGSTVPVAVTVFDASGNQAICTAQVTVADNTSPVATCPASIVDVVLDGNGNGTLPANIGDGSSTDNCSVTETSPAASFTCANIGVQTVTLSAFDGTNTSTVTCSFNVVDSSAPVAICPASIADVVLDGNGNGSLPANIGDGTSTDNCSVVETSPAASFTCANIGVRTVTLTASDGANSSTVTCFFNVVDNMPPVVNCRDITISLGSDGTYSLLPSGVFLSGTDNCGTVSPTAVSQASFNCTDEGTNTVTLTGSDPNGNTATCSSIVTVTPFITGFSSSHTDETCAGAGDGTIALSASAPSGQIGYSIDGGVNFQFNGSFSSLTPGNYTVVVKIFGVQSNCQLASTTITVASGGSTQTWYKDMDGDGHSDGMTLNSCTQPAGYYLSADLAATSGDCNDSDPMVYPGQTWYEDFDADGHSSGNWSTACARPTGCYAAAELSATTGDCDDNEVSVYPGATEVCNGIDDDCDGSVDEDLSGGLTWVGNVMMTTQADVDAWSHCHNKIDGNLTIQGTGIDSLESLRGLEKVTGNVTIQMTGIDTLHGLDSLEVIGGGLTVYFNSTLKSLAGLDSLDTVGVNLMVYYNFILSDGCPIHDLLDSSGGIGGSTSIFFNSAGANSVADINASCGPQTMVSNPNGTGIVPANQSEQLNVADKEQQPSFRVFPNPASDWTIVELAEPAKGGTLQVAELTGRIIFETSLEHKAKRTEVNLLGWKPGTYFIILKMEGRKPVTQKLIVIEE